MEFAISEVLGKDPFYPLSVPSQALQWDSIFGPNETFVVAIPVKLEMLFL
jgi:hypothetical protein